MSKMFADVQPAVERDEEGDDWNICMRSLMWAVLESDIWQCRSRFRLIIQCFSPVPLAGWWRTELFPMGLTVQKIVSMEDDKQAARR